MVTQQRPAWMTAPAGAKAGAAPTRWNPATRQYELFSFQTGQWTPTSLSTADLDNLARSGRVYEVDYAATDQGSAAGPQMAKTTGRPGAPGLLPPPDAVAATGRQSTVAPAGPVGAGLSTPQGAPYTREQLATLYNLQIPEGSPLTAPSGQPYTVEQLQTLYGTGPSPPTTTPTQGTSVQPQGQQPASTQAPPERGNNPTAQMVNGAWNVDAGPSYGRPVPAATPKLQPPPDIAAEWEVVRNTVPGQGGTVVTTPGQPPPPTVAATEGGGTIQTTTATQPAVPASAGATVDREGYWQALLLGQGGGNVPRYEMGGEHPEEPSGLLPPPNAIVGEGLESDGGPVAGTTDRFRLEVAFKAKPEFGPDIFQARWSEGPTAASLDDGTIIVPVPTHLEELIRDELLPLSGKPLRDMGNGAFADAEGNNYRMGGRHPRRYQSGGQTPTPPTTLLPPPEMLAPEYWQGLGDPRSILGNWNQYSRASDPERERLDQGFKSFGFLGGSDAFERRLKATAPAAMSGASVWA